MQTDKIIAIKSDTVTAMSGLWFFFLLALEVKTVKAKSKMYQMTKKLHTTITPNNWYNSTLCGYIIMSVVCTLYLYGYQDSASIK